MSTSTRFPIARFSLTLLIAIVGAIVLLAGCGGGDDDTEIEPQPQAEQRTACPLGKTCPHLPPGNNQ